MAKHEKLNQFDDLNLINSDWSGTKYINSTHELVAYHNDTIIRIWRNVEPRGFKPHWHSSIEIVLPIENHYDAKISNTAYHINPGEILVIPPRELHELIAPPDGVRFIFQFNINVMAQLKGFAAKISNIQLYLFLQLRFTLSKVVEYYIERCGNFHIKLNNH